VPTRATPVIMATAINDAMRPYSSAVTPLRVGTERAGGEIAGHQVHDVLLHVGQGRHRVVDRWISQPVWMAPNQFRCAFVTSARISPQLVIMFIS
jgi:hypothetical protein